LEDAIKLAINAGVDIMTFSNKNAGSDERTVDKVHNIIRKMVDEGEIKPGRIDESFKRIMLLKQRLQENDQVAFYKRELDKTEIALEGTRQEKEILESKLRDAESRITEMKMTKKEKKKLERKKKQN
jgi:beta-N-acetylhexosaminidase